MPLSNFTRPPIPYANAPLPNDNRFNIITRILKKPITTDQLDGEFNSITDNLNTLDNKLEAVQAGIITGSDNPLNSGKFPTTNGAANPIISWVNVTDANIDDGEISGIKITPLTIGTEQLDNGIVTPDKIPDNSIPYSKTNFDEEDIPYNVINVPEGAIPGSKMTEKSITQGQLALLSVGTPELINGSVTRDKIADHEVTLVKLENAILNFMNALMPVGASIEWSGTTPPTSIPTVIEWKEENGQPLNRVTYAGLFANIGTLYGDGDGATTFNLRDRRGRVGVGIGSDNSTGGHITAATAPEIRLGSIGVFGAETHKLTSNEMPVHNHSINTSTTLGVSYIAAGGGLAGNTTTDNAGGDFPHNNTQPSIFVRYYIRAL